MESAASLWEKRAVTRGNRSRVTSVSSYTGTTLAASERPRDSSAELWPYT